MGKRWRLGAIGGLVLGAAAVGMARQSADEDVARRQLESGRSFARQGNYAEALKDFRAVADTHGSSTVADNALLEIARYYLDVVGDSKEAATAVEVLLRKYPTSDSAPDAYLITGRLALARSHQQADLTTALANFDRVARLFPNADAVPASLLLSGEALSYSGRLDDALASLVRVEVEYPESAVAPQAYLTAGHVLTLRGDAIGAMEELQQVRNRWPKSPEAEVALGRLTVLHRLYIRARGGAAAFAQAPDTVGPTKLQNVTALGTTGTGAIYWAAETGLGLAAPAKAQAPPASRPRGLALDSAHGLWAIEVGALRPFTGQPMPIMLPKQNGVAEPMEKIAAAVQLSNGDWLVADEDQKAIHRFKRGGEYVGLFAPAKVSRLAVNAVDEIVGIDREQKGLVFFDDTGRSTGRIAAKTTAYDIENMEDVRFDEFGHLYILDRTSIVVFSPFGAAPAPATAPGRAGGTPPRSNAAAAPAATSRAAAYRLVTTFSEPEKNPTAFRKGTAFALDQSGAVYLYDERAERIRVYR